MGHHCAGHCGHRNCLVTEAALRPPMSAGGVRAQGNGVRPGHPAPALAAPFSTSSGRTITSATPEACIRDLTAGARQALASIAARPDLGMCIDASNASNVRRWRMSKALRELVSHGFYQRLCAHGTDMPGSLDCPACPFRHEILSWLVPQARHSAEPNRRVTRRRSGGAGHPNHRATGQPVIQGNGLKTATHPPSQL